MPIEVYYVAAAAMSVTLGTVFWARRFRVAPKRWFRVGFDGSEQKDFIEACDPRDAASQMFLSSGTAMVARIDVEGTADHEGEHQQFALNYSCHCKHRKETD